MVTTKPARALRLENRLGVLKPGAWADLAVFAVPASSLGKDPCSCIIDSTEPPSFLMVHGRPLPLS
jgi:cytosine/adenosine deaminase-related metal-dependent hydrolase